MNERAYQVFRDLFPCSACFLVRLSASAVAPSCSEASGVVSDSGSLSISVCGNGRWRRNMAENAAAGYDSSIGSAAEFVYSAAKLSRRSRAGLPRTKTGRR